MNSIEKNIEKNRYLELKRKFNFNKIVEFSSNNKVEIVYKEYKYVCVINDKEYSHEIDSFTALINGINNYV